MIETFSQLTYTQKCKSKKLKKDTSPFSTDLFKVMMEEYIDSGTQLAPYFPIHNLVGTFEFFL